MSSWERDPVTGEEKLISGSSATNFVGTSAEWEALTDAEKRSYDTMDFTDDGGFGNSYDIPHGNSNVGDDLDTLNTYSTYSFTLQESSSYGVPANTFYIYRINKTCIFQCDIDASNLNIPAFGTITYEAIPNQYKPKFQVKFPVIDMLGNKYLVYIRTNGNIVVQCFQNTTKIYGFSMHATYFIN